MDQIGTGSAFKMDFFPIAKIRFDPVSEPKNRLDKPEN